MKTRGAFNLFLASVSAALTLALLNVWGRPEWFDLFPLSYALRFFQSLRTYTASCLVFFAFLTLRRAGGPLFPVPPRGGDPRSYPSGQVEP